MTVATGTTSRSSRRLIRTWEDLLTVTECQDQQELHELIDSETTPHWWLVRADPVEGVVQLELNYAGYDLTLPFTLGKFWRSVDSLNEHELHRLDMEQLPEWRDESEATSDVTWLLADFLGVHLSDFVDHVGGGWHPQDGSYLEGQGEVTYRWFASGEPVQVLLGFGVDEVVVAEPVQLPLGYYGPARVEQGLAHAVELRRARTLRLMRGSTPETSRPTCAGHWTSAQAAGE